MGRTANGGSSGRGCPGRSWTRCARQGLKSALRRSTTSIAGTTKARPISRSTSVADAAGARRGASSGNHQAAKLAPRHRRACGRNPVRGATSDRLALQPRRPEHEARARGEVILAAGAIGSPQLLELSGVGEPESLGVGVPVVRALPEVGENLQDHLQLRAIFSIEGARTLNVDFQSPFKRATIGLDYALRRRGPMTMAPSQLGMFARSYPDYATANVEFHVQSLVSGSLWGAAPQVSGNNDQRVQFEADKLRLNPCLRPRSARRALNPARTI